MKSRAICGPDFDAEMTGRPAGPTGPTDQNEPDESSYMLAGNDGGTRTIERRPDHERGHTDAPYDNWGWYVVGGCAFANFLLPGMLRSFVPDVLDGFVEVHDFEGRFVSHWIPATFDLMFSIAGALSCLLCDVTSYRTITFCGGILASVGMMASSFASSILYLYISYGIMVGFGAGLCYPVGLLVVNEYFDEHRGLANGLSLAGTTVGSFALPSYLKFLTSSYGYRGGILIVSGMMLNVLVCAMTYRPANEYARFIETMTSSSSITLSINVRGVATTAVDEYYAAVASSSLSLRHASVTGDDAKRFVTRSRRQWFDGGGKVAAEFLAVSAMNALGHLAHGAFAATVTPLQPPPSRLGLATADVAGRVLAPALSDLLSSGGSASVYLYAVAAALGGTVLLTVAGHADRVTRWSHNITQTRQLQMFAFALASGAAVGLEPLVAVRLLGRERLSASYSASMLGKGAAQLAVDLLLVRSTGPEPSHQISASSVALLYVLGFCSMATAVTLLYKRYRAASMGHSRYVRTA